MRVLLSLLVLLSVSHANLFRCIHCNDKPGEDDKQPCIDKSESCPDKRSTSCSTVQMKDRLGETHIRKFCTVPGLDKGFDPPVFNGTVCKDLQHIEKRFKRGKTSPGPPGTETKSSNPGAPKPADDYAERIVCICKSSNCNKGNFDVIKAGANKA